VTRGGKNELLTNVGKSVFITI